MNNEVYFWHGDKRWSWYYDFGCAYPGMPKVPKIRSSHIFATVSKSWGMKLASWLQINTKIFYKLIDPLWVYITCHF